MHELDSGRPGPTVLVQALTHGNEYCGAIALLHLFEQRPQAVRGRLILAFANVEAFSRFDPAAPHASRYVDEDYNRVWGDDAARSSAALQREREHSAQSLAELRAAIENSRSWRSTAWLRALRDLLPGARRR